jgi:hypothetical protein
MEEKARQEEPEGVDRATMEWHRRETAQKKLDMGKRLTAEVWAATGNHCINTKERNKSRKSSKRFKKKKNSKKICSLKSGQCSQTRNR